MLIVSDASKNEQNLVKTPKFTHFSHFGFW